MVQDILRKVGLEHRFHYKPGALSGGQRQRIAVARGIVHHPRLILADEPTAALDKKSGRKIVTLFQELAQKNRCTILLVTHDNRILDVADQIINMVDGCIASDMQVDRSLEICQFLTRCRVFYENTPAALAEIAQNMRLEQCPPATVLFHQGDTGDKFYIIKQGQVDVLMGETGSQACVNHLGYGAEGIADVLPYLVQAIGAYKRVAQIYAHPLPCPESAKKAVLPRLNERLRLESGEGLVIVGEVKKDRLTDHWKSAPPPVTLPPGKPKCRSRSSPPQMRNPDPGGNGGIAPGVGRTGPIIRCSRISRSLLSLYSPSEIWVDDSP